MTVISSPPTMIILSRIAEVWWRSHIDLTEWDHDNQEKEIEETLYSDDYLSWPWETSKTPGARFVEQEVVRKRVPWNERKRTTNNFEYS
jgi:hypothetical protein